MPPPRLLELGVGHSFDPEVKIGVRSGYPPPKHSCPASVIVRGDDYDGAPMVLLNAGEESLCLLSGGVHVLAGFADINSASQIAAIGPFEIGPRNRGDGLAPIRLL